MVTKPIPADPPVTFGALERPQSDQTLPDLSREAKKLNNAEKGNRADERYLGQQQNLAEKARRYAKTGIAPWDDIDYDDPLTFDNWMD